MSSRTILACAGLLLLQFLWQPPGSAADARLETLLREEVERIRGWGLDSKLVKAARAQNAKKVPLHRIRANDMGWGLDKEHNMLMHRMMNNDCAKRLRELEGAKAIHRESFLMDDQGALVCMTRETSDYWQGDEDKWIRSFNEGKGTVFVDEPKRDASTEAVLIQISVPVMDGDVVIGVITAGLDYAELQRKARGY